MIRKGMGYTVGLIVLYMGIYRSSDAGKLITDGANGFSTVTKTLQGR